MKVFILTFFALAISLFAEEGMWPLNMVPKQAIEEAYGAKISDSWVDPLKKFCMNRGIAFFVKEAARRFGVELVREFPFQEAGNG